LIERRTSSFAADGIALAAAYGVVTWLTCFASRIVLLPQTAVSFEWPYALAVFAFYLLCGACLGMLARRHLRLVFVALFALNAIVQLSRFIRYWTVACCLLAACAIILEMRGRLPERLLNATNPWFLSLALVVPLFAGGEVFYERSIVVRAFAAAVALTIILLLAVLWPTVRNAHATAGVIALVLVLSLCALYRDSPKDSGPPRRAAAPGLPNIVVISMDTVRADHCSSYGYARATTPHIEQFARSATRFANAYAASNMTLAGHASMFTGLFPTAHGAHATSEWGFGVPLSSKPPTIAEILAARGYRTMAVAGNFIYLGQPFGVMRGFQYLDARAPITTTPSHSSFDLTRVLPLILSHALHLPPPPPGREAGVITRDALSCVDRANAEKRPFFLFLNYIDAHAPYLPPRQFASMFNPGGLRFDGDLPDRKFADQVAGKLQVTPAEREFMMSQYDGAIAYIDSSIAGFLDGLRARRAFDDTLIVITSDHGESFGDHGLVGHGSSAYDDQIRVPLFIKEPGQHETRVEQRETSLVDLFNVIRDQRDSMAAPVISESFPFDAPPSFRHPGRAVIHEGIKLIVPERGKPELYDLRSDPGEKSDVSASAKYADARAHLEQEFAEWWKRQQPAQAGRTTIDPETEERLRSLGYLR